MDKKLQLLLPLGLLAFAAAANQEPTGNANPTYSPSHVQAQLRLNIKEGAEVVHFVRDNNDPKIITKTYVLKHADPYSIRPYLREMVQAARVDYNNAVGRGNPDYYNVYNKLSADKLTTIFVPTGIECIKYNDGTGILMVSAEEYRFKDSPNGMGIDSLVAGLDQPNIMNSSGQPKYIYFPANRPAKELQTMVKLVGANMSNETVELIGGKDKIELDEDLNCLFFNTALYSRKNIEDMLRVYDVPHPEIRIVCKVYELDAENDGAIGVDFQSWKNNDGAKLFSTGAEFSKNYNIKNLAPLVQPDGTVNSHYFNFEPKWNSKFLDFLVSKGKAKIACTGELAIQNGSTGAMERTTGIMYAKVVPLPAKDSGNQIDVKPVNEKFKFKLSVTPSITEKAAMIQVGVGTVSMIGYDSSGAVRTSVFNSAQKIMLGTGRTTFYLGGIEKSQVISDVGGVPLLKDLPVLGWLFSTERESTKRTQLVVVAECELIQPNTLPDDAALGQMNLIRKETTDAGESNRYGYRQLGLDPAR